jgi:hypothetical protein
MNANRFDTVSRFFADRRLSRRQALARGGAGLAAAGLAAAGLGSASAQEATPEVAPEYDPSRRVPYLFVQSFEGGIVTPKDGEDGTYTVTLEHGLGQTLYFSDRPARDVGATPTPQFLAGLNFSQSNPPNAAFVLETAAGETDIAVVELFSPTYDEASKTATYDVKVLANWEDSTDLGFSEAPVDLATVTPSFGAAHLFIDDCADSNLSCCTLVAHDSDWGTPYCVSVAKDYGTVGYCAQYGRCVPCDPYFHDAPYYEATWDHWNKQCAIDVPELCNDDNVCEAGWWVD